MADKKSSVNLDVNCVCKDIVYDGNIELGKGNVIHPKSHFRTKGGPIHIGSYNIFEERVVIINERKEPLIIGDYNLFEVGTLIFSSNVGSNCNFQPRSQAEPGCKINDNCIIGPKCSIPSNLELPQNTVLYGTNKRRKHIPDVQMHQSLHVKHLSYLQEYLPKHNNCMHI
ncbi:trimeric LpxA-like protein [Neocallimastix lanati (nom. inval.)]|jgi:dynactin-6|uniref:Dynactin subunit 6 n=1 Tax=Neocallimastix californiae TaxID=1754190 RepID=A0A1Y2BRZ1_9FUNG|nr:trimeric LpxA-like protein [Neocallimastix sp. JGI-2020a]ORY37519.1 trimeric LpxA-like protein [Neocallimastix californiae]|eukprot:ORY37519.1 trimeric LpxA-like protein [Neocallimastix californiae]